MENSLTWQQETDAFFYLQDLFGHGKKTIRSLIGQYGSATEVCKKSFEELEGYFKGMPLEKRKRVRDKWNAAALKEAAKRREELENGGVFYVPITHPAFPAALREIPDPPLSLFYKGLLPDPAKPSLAIIGSRACSAYGSNAARWFGEQMALSGVQVISGLARGIDGIAQKGAMDAGGYSYGVLGSGVDVCYPSDNKRIYDRCLTQGGILSEYFPGTKPDPRLFPPRNRIISGLSDGVLVVEAGEKSGTLITVDMALDQGKEVFILPGRVTDRLSCGCNRLIAQGAQMALSPEDVLEKLYGIRKKQEASGGRQEEKMPEKPDLMSVLDWEPKTLQTLFLQLNETLSGQGYPAMESITELSGALMELCFAGKALQLPGGYYRLDDRLFGI